jgi:hypothetical protein
MPLSKDDVLLAARSQPNLNDSELARFLQETFPQSYDTFEGFRSAVRRAKGSFKPAPEPSFTVDKKNGEIDWREGLRLADQITAAKRKASFNQSAATIEFPSTEQVSFVCLGDLHFFSSGTDHRAIEELTDAILAEPNLYIVLLGDILETAINLRGVAEVQSNLMPTGYQIQAYESWLHTIRERVLFATWDNHASERFEKAAGCDFFGWITSRLVPFFDGIAHLDVKLGDQTYKLFATHKVRGRSQNDATYGQKRYGRFDAQDREILLAADSHKPGLDQYMDGETVKLAVNVGTLNTKSAYARRYFSLFSAPVFPVVTLYRDSHAFTAFWTLEQWSMAHGNLRKAA